jgi:hypothetical protein
MYLHNDWRRFALAHAIELGHYIVFKYDNHCILAVEAFNESM